MGKLVDAIQAKLEDQQQRAQEQAPDYQKDPKEALAYIKRQNAIAYERKEIQKRLIRELRKLPKEKQDEFYDRCIQPQARNTFTKAEYDDYMDPASLNGRNEYSWILNNDTFGQNWQDTVQTAEELIGQDAVNELAGEIDELVAPTHPFYPDEDKIEYPFENEIQELKTAQSVDSPYFAENMDILSEVNEELAVVKDDVREEINKVDVPGGNMTGYQEMVDRATYDMQNQFIRTDLENGKYAQKFPTMKTTRSADGDCYTMNDAEVSEGGPFTQQDLEEIRQIKPQVPEGLKNDILSVTDQLEKCGEDKFKNEYTTRALQDSGGKGIFSSEQGFKFYAYWPLYEARKDLAAAVKSKNMDQIREKHYAYKSLKADYDKMLQTVNKHQTGLSVGNVNSTRSLPGNNVNPLPLNHMEDFVGQSQLNGIFCLYALGKNTNATPQQLLEDPAKVMSEASQRHVEENGLGSRKTTGEKLYWGLSNRACRNFDDSWTFHTGMLASRAFDNIACMAEDPKDRKRIAGTGQLAIASGAVNINAHKKAWEKVCDSKQEQKKVLLQHAVLLPADEFDPLAYGEAFSKPDWKQQLDTGALIDRLKQEEKLDYGKLADRVEEIAAEAKKCDQKTDSSFSRDKLVQAAHPMFQEILKKATPQERETEGYKKLEAYTNKMLLTTDSFEEMQNALEEKMDVQKEARTGVFLSSTNSPEHDKMVRGQNTFRYKLMQMQGKELPATLSEKDKNYLKDLSLEDAYRIARNDTFDYAVKKSDHGRSDFFVHDTGNRRYNASMESIESMDEIADTLGLRSPSKALGDETRFEILCNRGTDEWTKDSTEIAAAKVMYSMFVEHEHLSPEEEAKKMDPKRVDMGVAYIRGLDSFKQMIKNEGHEKILDKIAEGHGAFTDAYIKGMNDVAKKNHQQPGKAPKDMSLEEKHDVWRQGGLQV